MPRQKTFKTVCVDSFLFFALFALAGHLTINFWERYTIQSELSTMKNSLRNLKNTITNIGHAYDNLHTELTDLIDVVDSPPPKVVIPSQNYRKLKDSDKDNKRCKTKSYFNRKPIRDIQVQAVLTKRNDKERPGVGTLTDADIVASKIRTVPQKDKSTGPMSKNTATNTKNSVMSTGITSDLSNSETMQYYRQCNHSLCNHLKRHKDHEHTRPIMY
ncbi:unnamed protein product [Chrysodeixis includens]|uniref:Uncharacterized protein n=1 Tax=Chrysodeixis includens TaxID=689277 RepID=A0A9P0BH54_CHRIL|nr:unnamed protein product [Chrysodeixis includens]